MPKKNHQILSDINVLLDTYCEECFLFRHHVKEKGRRYAHKFCIRQCSVGEKIKEMGKKLS